MSQPFRNTPLGQDLFSRFIAGMFDEKRIIGVSTVFQTFFGNPANGSETIYSPDANLVDIDIIRANERTAALVPRGTVSRLLGSTQKNLRTEQFSTFSRKYPLSVEEGDITGENLTTRVAGESAVNSGLTQMDRLRHHAVKIHHESVRRSTRLFERLAGQSLLTGKQDAAVLGTSNPDLQYDFRRAASQSITVSEPWSGGDADIMADLDAACDRGRAVGHVTFDLALVGSTAMNSMIRDAEMQKLAWNRRYELFAVGGNVTMPPKFQRLVDAGAVFQGKVRTPAGYELWLFTYNDVYTDENGAAAKYMPVDKVLLTSSTARCDRYFGPPEGLPMVPSRAALYREFFGFDPSAPMMPPNIKDPGAVINPAMFFNDAYVDEKWTRVTIRTQTAPIFATTQTDAFVVVDTEP